MNVLEKILEEIEKKKQALEYNLQFEVSQASINEIRNRVSGLYDVEKIVRSHMNDCKTFEFDFTDVKSFNCQCGRHYVNTASDGWIPVEERLPETNERVLATVRHSCWIADFYSDWVPEEEKIKHPETSGTYIGCIHENSVWTFVDEEGQDNICEIEFGQNLERVYDVVTHWKPLPKPYKPKKNIEDSGARS